MLDSSENWISCITKKIRLEQGFLRWSSTLWLWECIGGFEVQQIKLAINIHNWWDNAFLWLQCMCIHFMK